MSLAANALAASVFARLAADPSLTALVGPDGISDHPRFSAAMPHVLIGAIETGDFSTFTEDGEEHLIAIEIWSEARGHHEAGAIAAAIHRALDGAGLVLDGADLVDLSWRSTRTRHDGRSDCHVTDMRFRAVTE